MRVQLNQLFAERDAMREEALMTRNPIKEKKAPNTAATATLGAILAMDLSGPKHEVDDDTPHHHVMTAECFMR